MSVPALSNLADHFEDAVRAYVLQIMPSDPSGELAAMLRLVPKAVTLSQKRIEPRTPRRPITWSTAESARNRSAEPPKRLSGTQGRADRRPFSVTCAELSRRLPRQRLAVTEEAARWSVVFKKGRPEHAGCSCGDRTAATAHVCRRPSGADGVDEDALIAQLGGEGASESVQGRLGHAVGGGASADLTDRARFAGDVDDPRLRPGPQ